MFARQFTRLLCSALFFGSILLIATGTQAAIGDHISSTAHPSGGSLAVDGSDNYVLHGGFFGTVDFGGGPMTSVNFLNGDQYLARFDSNDNHQWSLQITPNGFGANNQTVAVDPAGNIYIAGTLFINSDIDFGGGPLVGPGIYMAKLNSSGVHQWSNVYGEGTVKSIAANNTHVVVTGYTTTGVDFGGGTVGTAGDNDVIVAQLTSAGAHVWSSGFGDASAQGGMSVALDNAGDVLVTGTFFGTIDLGAGPVVGNGLDLFLAKFSSAGAHLWSKVFDGTFSQGVGITAISDIATGPSNEVVIAGEMLTSVDFGGGFVGGIGFGDIYIAKFDATGLHQWSAAYGTSSGSDQGRSVAIDSSGNVLLTGNFVGDTDFGGGVVQFDGDPLNFDRNIFAALYDDTGAHLYSNAWGRTAGTSFCHFDSGDQMLLNGSGGSSIDFGGGAISPATLFVARLEGAAGPPTAVGDLPQQRAVSVRAYPNPFNPTTTIEYVVATPGTVRLAVYDVSGRLVDVVVADQFRSPGRYTARYEAGASGVYLARMFNDGAVRSVKLVAVK